MQTVADDAPRISLYVPALHSVHEPAETADLWVEYVPAAHGVHVADAAEEAYLPSLHGIHEVDAGGEDCPALHGRQVDESVAPETSENLPGTHMVHADADIESV